MTGNFRIEVSLTQHDQQTYSRKDNFVKSDGPETSRQTSSSGGIVVRTLKKLFLRSARVKQVEAISPEFRRIELAGGALRNVRWTPGQHIQVFFDGLTHRTYTPMSWNADTGHISLLIYLHGGGPGCLWARDVQEGDMVEFAGPSRSVDIPDVSQSVFLFGDETSFGLAAALKSAFVELAKFRAIFEVSNLAESRFALEHLGLDGSLCIERSDSREHLKAVTEQFVHDSANGGYYALTGNARSIQAVKKQLSDTAIKPAFVRVKPYWVEGKTGLD